MTPTPFPKYHRFWLTPPHPKSNQHMTCIIILNTLYQYRGVNPPTSGRNPPKVCTWTVCHLHRSLTTKHYCVHKSCLVPELCFSVFLHPPPPSLLKWMTEMATAYPTWDIMVKSVVEGRGVGGGGHRYQIHGLK